MTDEAPKIRILAVDDSVVNLKLLSIFLGKEGFEVITSHQSVETLSLAMLHEPALILLDTSMPGLSGLEVLHQLKANTRTQAIPVVMVTARNQGADVKTALEAGAFDYVKKPHDEAEIVARVRSAIRHRQSLEGLTGLLPPALFLRLLERELTLGKRNGWYVSLCLIRTDLVEDTAKLLSGKLRSSDLLGHHRRGDLAVLLSSCSSEQAGGFVQRLCRILDAEMPARPRLSIVTAGPLESVTAAGLMEKAEALL